MVCRTGSHAESPAATTVSLQTPFRWPATTLPPLTLQIFGVEVVHLAAMPAAVRRGNAFDFFRFTVVGAFKRT